MALAYVGGATKRWIGLSTDPKPTLQTESVLPPGSTVLETDTGRIARWNGEAWIYGDEDKGADALLAAIYHELVRIRTVLELFTGHAADGDLG